MANENKELARRLIEELDKGNAAIFKQLCAADFKLYVPGSSEPLSPEAATQFVETFYNAFPDYSHRIEDVIAERDKVVVRCVNSGTHKDEYMGIPATGKSFEYGAIVILHITDGKITEVWAQEDTMWMMEQLGMELKPKEIGT